MTHPVFVVLKKELLDGSRDRRAILSAFLFPVLAPVLVYFMLNAIVELRLDAKSLTIPVQGMEYAPDFVQFLRESDVDIKPFSGDARQVIRDKTEEVIVVIPENYQEHMAQAKTIGIKVVMDGARTDADATIGRVRDLIRDYNRQLGSLRLIARGISPEIASAIIMQRVDVASKEQIAARALNFIPLYIILAAFVAGMGVAVDSTAGERERKSIEPLLINPVERYFIVMGKWIAASLFSTLGMALTLVLCIAAMMQVPLDQIGLNFHIQGYQIALMFVATVPLAFLATSMQLFLGIFAKSFKDAQSYIGLLTMLPIIPSLYMMFNPLPVQDWMFAIPMLGQHLLLTEVLGARQVPLIGYISSGLTCFLLGLAFVMVTARLFERESIIA